MKLPSNYTPEKEFATAVTACVGIALCVFCFTVATTLWPIVGAGIFALGVPALPFLYVIVGTLAED